MDSSFRVFPDLPAELRLRIWLFAALNERLPDRIIELYIDDESPSPISFAISHRYPALYHTNREARYDAAKQFGGEFIPVSRKTDTFHGDADVTDCKPTGQNDHFEIYFNYENDTLFLSDRSTRVKDERMLRWNSERKCSIDELFNIVPVEALNKIQKLQLTCNEVAKEDITESDTLEISRIQMFSSGTLKKLVLLFDISNVGWYDVHHSILEKISECIARFQKAMRASGSTAPMVDVITFYEVVNDETRRAATFGLEGGPITIIPLPSSAPEGLLSNHELEKHKD